MNEYTIARTGQRPIVTRAAKVAAESGRAIGGKDRNRWHIIEVFKSAAGKWVVAVEYHTQWEGEMEYQDAVVLDSAGEAATFLEEYIFPNIGSIGYPPGSAFAERQARLIADLEAAWKTLASAVIAKLPAVAERVD